MSTENILDGINAVSEKVAGYQSEQKAIIKTVSDIASELEKIKIKQGKNQGFNSYDQKSLEGQLSYIIKTKADIIKGLSPGVNQIIEVKTMTEGANLTGSVYQSGVPREPIRPYYTRHISDIVPIIPVATGSVLYPQEAGTLSTGSFNRPGEGNTKSTIDYNLKTVTLGLTYLAGTATVSREMLADIGYLETYLTKSLVEDFKQAEDREYLPSLIATAVAGTTSETIAGAKALDYIVQLWALGRNVTAALVSPLALSNILKSKPNDYSIPGGVSYDANGNIRILGLPLIPCQFMSGSTMLAGDFDMGVGIARADELKLESTQYNGTNFAQNLVMFRAESREGLMLFGPKSFVYGTI